MEGLRVKVGNEERIFLADGNLAVSKDGTESVRGKWASKGAGNDPKENKFHYTIDGTSQTAIPVKYSFNEFNQLVVVAPKGGNVAADSNPFVFQGQIKIDDNHDIVYALFNKTGTDANNSITIYGELSLNEAVNSINIGLQGGGQATIKGEEGVVPITAEKNLFSFEADDLLRFFAVTRNDFSGSTTRTPKRASIRFEGKWNFKLEGTQNQLVFVSQVKTGTTGKEIVIGAAGRIGAVTAGFAYYKDANNTQLAFTIKGEHKWDSAEAKWNLKLGHSKNLFKASIDGEFVKNMPDGQFKLTGSFSIEHANNKKAAMKLSIQGTYESKNKMIVFKIMADTEENRYELSLDGKFVYNKTTLTFQVRFNKTGSGSKLDLEIATTSNKERLKFWLQVVLDGTNKTASLTFGFELRVRWKDGVIVGGQPTKEIAKDKLKEITN